MRVRVKGKLFQYTKKEFQRVRELLAAGLDKERLEIIGFAEIRGLFCEKVGDCARCDGDCKKSPDTGNMSLATAVA